MQFSRYIVLLTFCLISGIISKKPTLEEILENRMVGVDTVHNAKMNFKGRNNAYHTKDPDSQPDWSYNSIPEELSGYVQDFKRNMSECLKEVQQSDKRPVKRLSPKQTSPIHGECLIACVLKRNAVIVNGKINKANLIALINKFYAKDTKVMKKLEKNLDRCIELSVRARDDCHLAELLNTCTNELMSNNKHKITVNY